MPAVGSTIVERVRFSGVGSASTLDLLAIGFSRRAEDVELGEGMARQLLSKIGHIYALADLGVDLITDASGLEGFEVLRLQALIELGRRAGMAAKGDAEVVDQAADVYRLLKHLGREKKEHFCAILLDSQNAIIRTCTIHIGTLTMSVVGPREVFREAIREGASSIIVAHNHPSGNTDPSPEDIQVTDQLVSIGKMLDIPVVDHIIIGSHGYKSLRECGAME